ncbi:MAG: class I SAM-dependent methyltransferase [Pseudomonadota bacterium]
MSSAAGEDYSGYRYPHSETNPSHGILLQPTFDILEDYFANSQRSRRVFDLGCGNGSVASLLTAKGYDVTGIDPSKEGIAQAKSAYPNLRLEIGSAYDDLAGRYGSFPAVISLEVVEHVYAPRDYARTLFDLVEPGGIAVLSTPYHGYIKNVALALSGKMDSHFTALWDHGHIKFWSIKTLGTLLVEAGFEAPSFRRVGRVPPLAKSMIAIAIKPSV